MAERQQPHSWVPYGAPDIEEICALCGAVSTSTQADEPCTGTLDDMPEPPTGWEELPEGDDSPLLVERLTEPSSATALSQDDLAGRRAYNVAGMVAAVMNWQRGHGEPEEICKAVQPSLAAALGAWFDEQTRPKA
ncbi:MAG: hypothetical protein JO266_02705 [Acidobacteria bacterium]|nr:hypothetical protein [Acidobacteriota bacterium]